MPVFCGAFFVFCVKKNYLTKTLDADIMPLCKAKILYKGVRPLDRIVEKALLFDFYGELLTDHQKKVYDEYIQNDLSVSEMAAIMGISRQGAHDLIRRSEKILSEYEARLHLVAHFQKVKGKVKSILESAETIMATEDADLIREKARHIQEVSESILEEY